MLIAEKPHDEVERLAALYGLNILDTPPDERFDRVTRLATSVFEVPIAYVALIDANRQWFKSSCGLTSRETGRDVSFCSHVILQDEPLIISDTVLDERFHDNPLVTKDPYLRFYAGCPLRTPEGHKVATFCIGDRKPRALSSDDLSILKDMALMVEDQLTLVDVADIQRKLLMMQSDLRRTNGELERSNAFIRDIFGRFMTDEVAETLLASPEPLKLGGERRVATILMCDIRGFTPLSERFSPEDIVKALNNYLDCMIGIIGKYNGTIDSFIGDAILVLFGAPLSRERDAERAVACAIEMQLGMGEVNRRNEALGLPALQIGIGINTGEVIAGNIGSEKRMKYSVIGSPVNIAARVESLTIGGQILITERTLAEVRDIVRIDGHLRVKVKGLDECVSIYDIGGIEGEGNISLPKSRPF